jgi:hypothetical protein
MSAQPLNTDIKVYRRLRTQVANERHDPIKLQGRVRAKYAVVPGEEIRVLSTLDAVVTDAWRYGHPIVRYARTAQTPNDMYDNIDDLAFPIRLTMEPRDLFIEKTEAAVADDLFTEAQNV